jgi:F-type H+-transporting ATPase subunit delta
VAKSGSARRYARAVFELEGEGRMDDTRAELEIFAVLGRNPQIVAYLHNPKISYDDKVSLLHERIGSMSATVKHLVYLLVTKNCVNMLPDIADEYENMVDEYHGIERAEIVTAIPIDDKARENLSRRLSDITGKKVIIEAEKVDPSLIGGIMVKVAGKLIDGSTQGRLAELKKELI